MQSHPVTAQRGGECFVAWKALYIVNLIDLLVLVTCPYGLAIQNARNVEAKTLANVTEPKNQEPKSFDQTKQGTRLYSRTGLREPLSTSTQIYRLQEIADILPRDGKA